MYVKVLQFESTEWFHTGDGFSKGNTSLAVYIFNTFSVIYLWKMLLNLADDEKRALSCSESVDPLFKARVCVACSSENPV